VKYRLIIEEFGGWDAVPGRLLRALDGIARGTASLGQRGRDALGGWTSRIVAGADQSARAMRSPADTLSCFAWALDAEDHAALGRRAAAPAPAGDTYRSGRDRDGPHGRIMKYELNRD
jgi:hypothetical protein